MRAAAPHGARAAARQRRRSRALRRRPLLRRGAPIGACRARRVPTNGRRRDRRSAGRREGLPRAVRGDGRARPHALPARGRRVRRSRQARRAAPGDPRRGPEPRRRVPGHRDDIETLYSAMDVFVLASHREGFPRAAMEAAAMGLPVVATDVRGCRQVVEDGRTGSSYRCATPARSPRPSRPRGRSGPAGPHGCRGAGSGRSPSSTKDESSPGCSTPTARSRAARS